MTLVGLLQAIGAAVRFGGGSNPEQYEQYNEAGEYILRRRRANGLALCPKCGRKTSRESRYCQRCGHVPAGGFK